MRKIKFRGVRADNGEYVYGDLEHHKNHVFIDDKRVVPVTVSQLCGFDRRRLNANCSYRR